MATRTTAATSVARTAGTTNPITPVDLSSPAAAAALTIAAAMYEKMLPLRVPPDPSPERIAEALATQARQVGLLAWEILHGLHTPRQP